MSRSHIRVTKPARPRRRWLEAIIAAGFLLILIGCFVISTEGWVTPEFDSTSGTVIDTRIEVDHARESQYGGKIYYRLEARVQYETNGNPEGQLQVRWLTAYEVTTTRELLLMEQDKHSKNCRVYWIRNHPETAKCQLL